MHLAVATRLDTALTFLTFGVRPWPLEPAASPSSASDSEEVAPAASAESQRSSGARLPTLDPEDVSERVERVIDAGLAERRREDLDPAEIIPWYHDAPIWLYVSSRGRANRVLQVAVVQDRGRRMVEISGRLQILRPDAGQMIVPVETSNVRTIAEEELTPEVFLEGTRLVWEALANDEPDPQSGGDPRFVAVPLSRQLLK